MAPRLIAFVLCILALSACSRGETLRCAGGSLYRGADSAGQLRVPDDLSVPDETEALRVPGPTGVSSPDEQTGCLEYSPAYRNRGESE